tara:strand:+ start:1623 stop:1916 length:294 start_codon:yes stop_codon:yes gene_type:complete
MTNLSTNPIVQAFVFDLDENVVNVDTVAKDETVIDFINPVNNALERVMFHDIDDSNTVGEILYVPGYHKEGEMYTKDEYEMEDIEELYEWVLIDMLP